MVLSACTLCRAQVVINEVLYDPDGNDTGFETIELLNTGTEPFSLDTYELKTADSNYYTFIAFTLAPEARVIIHNNTTGDDTATDLYTGPLANMGNTHGSVALFSGPHAAGNIIDFVQYGGPDEQWESAAVAAAIWTEDDFTADVDEGLSLNLDPDGIDTNSSTDWAACFPSPLEPNCLPLPTATASPEPTHTPAPTATPTAPPPTSTPTPPPPTPPPPRLPPP
nr:lamin tail domain-containing protein [bacterium]